MSDLGKVLRRRSPKDGGGPAQPESDLESTPIFLMISNLISDIVEPLLFYFIGHPPADFIASSHLAHQADGLLQRRDDLLGLIPF